MQKKILYLSLFSVEKTVSKTMNNFRSSIIGILIIVATSMPSAAAEITPIDLVFQGYQGRLVEAGIPGYAAFRQAVFFGKIDAETLVESAVARGKLPSSILNNKSYLRQVEASLFKLRAGGASRG